MIRRPRCLAIAASLCLSACGGGGSPSAPTPPPSNATVTGISLSALEFVRLGTPQRIALSATMSDGTTRAVEGTWQSSDPAIATVAADGLVTGVASGEVIVTVQYQSFRADRALRVVPNYDGSWSGGYRIATCADEGDWAGVCEGEDPNFEWSIDVRFAQQGGNVTGLVRAFEDADILVAGPIAVNGRLSVAGDVDLGSATEPFILEIANWDTGVFDSNRLMNGKFEVAGHAPDLTGEFRYFCEITVLNRVSAAPGRLDQFAERLIVKPRPFAPRITR